MDEAAIQLQIQEAVAAAMAAHAAVPSAAVPVAHVAVKLPTFLDYGSRHVVFSGGVFIQQVPHHHLLHQV